VTYSQPPGQPIADQPAGRIVVHELSKTFQGKIRAVDQLSFTVEPGSITGFLGPNGAGKTTTLRMALGLVNPTSGYATIGGRRYRDIDNPLTLVGASLESSSFHPARTGRNHLRILCTVAGLPVRRADEVLDLVGLHDAGRRKVRGYSLGMRQRLGLAACLIGDPRVLVLDEPANGLDPEGIRWLRGFFRHLADEGRTILVSSHQLNEVQEIADRVVILNRGKLIRSGSIAELTAGTDTVRVRTPNAAGLNAALAGQGLRVQQTGPNTLELRDATLEQVGHIAFAAGVELHELSMQRFDLEQLFFALTEGTADAPMQGALPPQGPPPPPHAQQQAWGPPPQGPPPQGWGPPPPQGPPPPGGPTQQGPVQGGAPWSG
jgi:ABC-2 type transport system ATP-binding protein